MGDTGDFDFSFGMYDGGDDDCSNGTVSGEFKTDLLFGLDVCDSLSSSSHVSSLLVP